MCMPTTTQGQVTVARIHLLESKRRVLHVLLCCLSGRVRLGHHAIHGLRKIVAHRQMRQMMALPYLGNQNCRPSNADPLCAWPDRLEGRLCMNLCNLQAWKSHVPIWSRWLHLVAMLKLHIQGPHCCLLICPFCLLVIIVTRKIVVVVWDTSASVVCTLRLHVFIVTRKVVVVVWDTSASVVCTLCLHVIIVTRKIVTVWDTSASLPKEENNEVLLCTQHTTSGH